MTRTVRLVLLAIAVAVIAVDVVWRQISHYPVDTRGLRFIAEAAFIPVLLGIFYTHMRKDERMSAMLFGLAFLLVFSPACSIYTYYALTIAGPRIDDTLAAVDRALWVNWPAWIAFAANHPLFNSLLSHAYHISAWQPVLLTLWLGWRGDPRIMGMFYLALALSALTTALLWTAFPSFGAVTIYWIPGAISAKLGAAVGNEYGHALLHMLTQGPATIDPLNIRGLIGFPSFHTVESVLIVWYARQERWLFPPCLAFNIVAIAAAPIQGGHHFIDVIGGGIVAFASIWSAATISRRAQIWDAERDYGPIVTTSPPRNARGSS